MIADKPKRLETANFARALAAVEWEIADTKASETGLASDRKEAEVDDQLLDAADAKIKRIQSEP